MTTEKISPHFYISLFISLFINRCAIFIRTRIRSRILCTIQIKIELSHLLARLLADQGREEDRLAGEAAIGSRSDLVPQLLEGRTAAVPLQFRRQGNLRQR